MEVFGKSMISGPANVVYLSTILGRDGPIPVHKCDWKCENEHVFGNMYRCRLTGLTHICDKNCNQRILYDNHSSLCRASGQIFPFSPAEEQAVRGVRRKLDTENSNIPSDSCSLKRRRDAKFHPSPFERSFSAGRKEGGQERDFVSSVCNMFYAIDCKRRESLWHEAIKIKEKLIPEKRNCGSGFCKAT
ncbi:unnamed protein product [Dovyalis caffra]|uniref:Uncharacterized protein n=1 Tax=Dovyalis caffra TaxID=77055 RepID=A0AAV1QUG1_9ROSI|nr:unnamed protein product [Dovyalis caffra]